MISTAGAGCSEVAPAEVRAMLLKFTAQMTWCQNCICAVVCSALTFTFTVKTLLSELPSFVDIFLAQDVIRLVDDCWGIVCVDGELVGVLEIADVLKRLALMVELVFK